MNLKFSYSSIIALALLVACAAEESPQTVVKIDDVWFNPPASTEGLEETISPERHGLVAPERIAEAEKFLEHEQVTQISPSEISHFAGKDIHLPDVSRPYLIRGLHRTSKDFSIRIIGNALWVSSNDDPADTAAVSHQPLVLIMDEVPETVYVTVGTTP